MLKKLMSFALACVLFLTSTVTVLAAGVVQPRQPDTNLPLYSLGESHSYDAGIIDGGIYRLRNIGYYAYMAVENASSQSGARIIGDWMGYSGGDEQHFVFSYLGDGLYEIKPVAYDTVLHAQGNNILSHTKNRSNQQKFKLHMVGQRIGMIYTMDSNFTKVLCYGHNDSDYVSQETYSSLSDDIYAQWEFQRVDTITSDEYYSYYIRNLSTGRYLDVYQEGTASGSLVVSQAFTGKSSQEWKLTFDSDTFAYSLVAGHRRDMALDFGGEHVAIQNDIGATT